MNESQVSAKQSASPTTGDLFDALYAAFQANQDTIQPVMVELDLSDALADVLWNLGEDEELPRREIAGRLKCDPSNVTFLVDRLESRGLVERVPVAGDRRVKAIRLSADGAAARRRLVSTTQSGSVFASLSDAERTELHRLLRLCARTAAPSTN
jgi:DNA-binding MarR family transcriptional regulator